MRGLGDVQTPVCVFAPIHTLILYGHMFLTCGGILHTNLFYDDENI